MGIKGLDNIIKRYCGVDAIGSSSLSSLIDKKVCIDISELIYKSIRKNKEAHVSGILNLIELLTSWKIKPLIVFDGKTSNAKSKVTQSRYNKRAKAYERKMSLQQQLELASEMEANLSLDDIIIMNSNDDSYNSSPVPSSSSCYSSDSDLSRNSSCIDLSS